MNIRFDVDCFNCWKTRSLKENIFLNDFFSYSDGWTFINHLHRAPTFFLLLLKMNDAQNQSCVSFVFMRFLPVTPYDILWGRNEKGLRILSFFNTSSACEVQLLLPASPLNMTDGKNVTFDTLMMKYSLKFLHLKSSLNFKKSYEYFILAFCEAVLYEIAVTLNFFSYIMSYIYA